MLKKILMLGMVTFLTVTSYAATVSLYQDTSQYSFGNGGEFNAVTSGNGVFQTFCVQDSVTFYPGHQYNYVLSNVDSSGKPLSLGAAWLYNKFINGSLGSYDYNFGINREVSAGALQKAFWWLQGDAEGVKNSFVTDAESFLSLDDTGIRGPANGAYDVVIMQLFDSNGTVAQNQLAIVPVPEPTTLIAGALLLLPFLASTFKIVRCRTKAV